ncbi:MAG: hypothetical protein JXO48_09400 [Deltaproteobacteria bacterium]|nr:hypothetical protein [Deltaproteobacteria bacterium]
MMKTYYEVVVEGSFECVKGFVLGYLEGSELDGEVIFGREHHIENEDKFGQLLRLLNVRGRTVHFIVGAGFHELLSQALERRKGHLDINIVSVKEIKTAYFDFSYRAYTRELGDKLKELFGSLSDHSTGLHLEAGYKPVEKINPEGKGVEAYAPLHEYELRGKGRIHGPIKDVIDFYGKAEHCEMVELGDIRLEYT